MKQRPEERRKAILACLLLLVGFVLIGGQSLNHSDGPTGLGEVSSLLGTPAQARTRIPLDPTLRLDRLVRTESLEYEGTGRNIFYAVVDQQNPTSTLGRQNPLPEPPSLAVLPSIPLIFFGFSKQAGVRVVFLSKGEDIFVANEGDIIDRRYKILRVAQDSVDVEDLLNEQRQKLWLRRR